MWDHLTTEARNPASDRLDTLTPLEFVRLMNSEDAKVAEAVGREAEQIAAAIEVIADRLQSGGRLIHIGAGTSGRLGVLDAAECPPTFNADPRQVVGVIAGGRDALVRSIEGAEDHAEMAAEDLRKLNLNGEDVLVGIATSGSTPYVIGGLDYAETKGAFRIGITCNRDGKLIARTDISIAPIVGPEILSGSTRMKAGTATKMVLNMLSTGAMVRLGKTYGNLMVDLRASNTKLANRAERIVASITNLSREQARELLNRCDGEVKTAVVAQLNEISPSEARKMLEAANGHLRRALDMTRKATVPQVEPQPGS